MGKKSLKDLATDGAAQAEVMRKAAARRQAHIEAQADAEFTPAQRIMRGEMAAGAHQPQRLDGLLDEAFGPLDSSETAEMARRVIDAGPNLTLSFQQWQIVQELIEEGIKRGHQHGYRRGFSRADAKWESHLDSQTLVVDSFDD